MAIWLRRLFSGCCTGQEMKGSGKMAKYPVCSMEVDEEKAAGTSEDKGKTYSFCALGYNRAFDENPERYLKEATREKAPVA